MDIPNSPNVLQFLFHRSTPMLSFHWPKWVSRTQAEGTQCYSRVKGYICNQSTGCWETSVILQLLKSTFSFDIKNKDYQWRTNEAEVCTSLFTHSRCCLTFRNCTLSQILHRNFDFPELQWVVLLICSLVYLDLLKFSNSSMLYLLLVLKISDGFKQF